MTNHSPTWRKSSYSADSGNCVEVATVDRTILVRNSNRLTDGTLPLTTHTAATLITACRSGHLDHLID